jgi:glutamate-5-semialdehyde dehydrogenase
MDIRQYVIDRAKLAKNASRRMSAIGTEVKNSALMAMAKALKDNKDEIIDANSKDIEYGKSMGFSKSLLDRLLLDEKRIEDMAEGLRQLTALPDPIGEVTKMSTRPNGLQIGQIRVPLGVIGMIYEARPNVTVDAAGICLKTGNVVVLRGGKEAINSNIAITKVISSAAVEKGLPEGCIQLIDITDKEAVNIMLRMNEYFDVIIPRGGAGLIRTVVENATVPVIETGVGNCHVYVDSDADLNMAKDIAVNAKTHRPAVCNAMETLLVHEKVAKDLLPSLSKKLIELGVELRGCEKVQSIVSEAKAAGDEDWSCEYLDLILAVKVVESLDEAIEHIYKYGTKHSEAIVTNNYSNSRRFLKEVDAAAVYVNASTRFTDGFQFGFGAEIGISTQKLHARGPMGLNELTTTKYIVYGEGQIRE